MSSAHSSRRSTLDALKVTVREAPSLAVFRVLCSGDADLGVSVGPYAADTIAGWADRLARFTVLRYGQG
jgi:hypothetical protein